MVEWIAFFNNLFFLLRSVAAEGSAIAAGAEEGPGETHERLSAPMERTPRAQPPHGSKEMPHWAATLKCLKLSRPDQSLKKKY